jgi:anti-sigma factor RsiW
MLCPIQEGGNAEVLLAYCARSLDPGALAVLERHIEVCPACRKFAGAQRLVWEALDAWKPGPVSDDFDDRLYARARQQETERWWRQLHQPRSWFSWRPALSMAAACITVFAVFLFRSPDASNVPAQGSRPETVDVEQVERTLEDMEMLRQFSLAPASLETREAKPL